MTDRIITREVLNDWILNDGLEHLLEEGYLDPDEVDPEDPVLRQAVIVTHAIWKRYQVWAENIRRLVGE